MDYLGPDGTEVTLARIVEIHEETGGIKTLSDYSRDLRKIGFYAADNSAVLTVARLFNAGMFGGGAVLVGSHAFGALLNDLGASLSAPMTEDVDIARPHRIEVAALPDEGLLGLLRETGLRFEEAPGLKRGAPATSFKVRGKPLKVDLLVPAKGEPYRTVRIPELKAHATGLRFLEFLLEGPGRSVLLGRNRIVPIVVPDAGRFCVHKLAVYSLRPAVDDAKREKDAFQAAVLAAILAPDQAFLLEDAIAATSAGLRAKARPGARRAIKWLGRDHPEAAELIGALA